MGRPFGAWVLAHVFFQHGPACLWQSDVYTHGQNGADFLYGAMFVDGRNTYRLTGRMGDLSLFLLQTHYGFPGDPDFKYMGNYDWNDFEIAEDGSFEVILSAEQHSGNWIQLAPDNDYQFIQIRRALPDWHGDQGHLDVKLVNAIDDDYYNREEFAEDAIALRTG